MRQVQRWEGLRTLGRFPASLERLKATRKPVGWGWDSFGPIQAAQPTSEENAAALRSYVATASATCMTPSPFPTHICLHNTYV